MGGKHNILPIGTSSRSTKLLHGGIRYLEKAAKTLDYGEFKLVTEVNDIIFPLSLFYNSYYKY